MGRSVSLKNIRDQQHLFPVLTRRQLSQHLSDTHGCCIPKTIVRGRCHYYYHFADEDTEAQRGRVICPRLHSFRVARLGLEPQQLTYTALTLKPAEGNSPARPRSLLGRQRRRSPWPAPLSAAMEGAWRAVGMLPSRPALPTYPVPLGALRPPACTDRWGHGASSL